MTRVHPRITIEADKRDEEIIEEHPGLEKEDFAAVYAFAADVADTAYGHR